MINRENVDSILSSDVYDADGDKIGGVGQVFLDDATGEPTWVSVSTGWFGSSQSFVPLSDATVDDNGVRVPYSKDMVKDAPRVDVDEHLSPAEEEQLYAYYSRTDYNDWDGRSFDADRDADAAVVGTRRDVDVDRDVDVNRGVDRDVDVDVDRRGVDVDVDRRAEGDLSMTRSEERLNVGKEQVEGGRVRLRKYVTTEQQTVNVPVQKEVLSVERTPVEGDARAAGAIHDTGEQVEEVVLREERPVVNKETVAVENVAIGKDTVTEQREVTETIAKEHIEVEGEGVDADGRPLATDTREGVDVDRDRDDRSLMDKAKDKLDPNRGDDDRSLMDKAKDKLDPDHDGEVLETGNERRNPNA